MPTCEPYLLTPVVSQIVRLQPKSVLDLGIGTGKWGVLVREYTDIWYRRYERETWKTLLHGIEIFEKYRNILWEQYNQVFIGNALNVLPTLGQYDMVLAFEILEHLSKEDGWLLLGLIQQKAKTFLFSFTNSGQGEVLGNPYERHISRWSPQDFEGLNARLLAGDTRSQLYIVGG